MVQVHSDGGVDQDATRDTPCKCLFSRAEAELMGTITSSSLTRDTSERLMRWVSNKRFRGRDIRPVTVRTLTDLIVKEYAPGGVMSVDFTEAMDGD